VKAEQEAKRAARVVPSSPKELVEYLLNTEGDEMNYELVRCRPLMVRAAAARLAAPAADPGA